MGGSSQPDNVTQTTKTELPSYLKPFSKELANRASDLSNRPYEAYPGQRLAGFNPDIDAAMGMGRTQALGGYGRPETEALYRSTIAGDFLGGNPHLDAMYDRAARAVTDQYKYATQPGIDAMAMQARALGGSGHQQYSDQARWGLGNNLGNLATDIYGGAYETERARQQAMMGMAPMVQGLGYQDAAALQGIGDYQRAYEQEELNLGVEEWEREWMHPLANLDILSQGLSGASGGAGMTTSVGPGYYQPSPLVGMLGGGLTGYGMGHMMNMSNPWLGAALGAGGGYLLGR